MRSAIAVIFVLAATLAFSAEIPRKIGPHTRISGGAFVVRLKPGADTGAVREELERAGLVVVRHRYLLKTDVVVMGDSRRIFALSERPDVTSIFAASQDLLTDTEVVACGGPAWTDADHQDAPVGYVAESPGWPHSGPLQLNYVLGTMTERLPAYLVQNEIIRAMAEWAKWAPIQFTTGAEASAPRTLSIFFGRGSHGDGYPFDGPGKMLAHTFYPAPPNSEPLAGDLHLDADENWAIGTTTDVYTVVLHELGHALGLGHSDQPDSVMYPYYRFGMVLSSDDIAGLQAIYGSGSGQPPGAKLALSVASPTTSSVSVGADSLAISGTATGATSVSWRNDRGGSGTTAGTARWSATVALWTGLNNVTVTASDGNGGTVVRALAITRQASAPPASDTVAPSLKVSFPAASYSTTASSVTCQGSASDNIGVTQVVWANSAGGSGTATGTAAWSAVVALQKGTNVVTIRARDAAGNESWRSVVISRK